MPTATKLTEDINSKLDKSEWDKEHEQFGISGYYSTENGSLVVTNDYYCTPILPLNRNFDLVYKAITFSLASTVIFFDAGGKKISYIQNQTELTEQTILKKDFPPNACYFAVSTRSTYADTGVKNYSNGDTVEAREGAVSDAINASKIALFIDQWNAACGEYGKYDPKNAPDPEHPFYLNTLWLTYEDAARVMRNIQRPPYNILASKNDLYYIKTNIFSASPLSTFDNPIKLNAVFAEWLSAEVINLDNGDVRYATQLWGQSTFRRCRNLREIIGPFKINDNTSTLHYFL